MMLVTGKLFLNLYALIIFSHFTMAEVGYVIINLNSLALENLNEILG